MNLLICKKNGSIKRLIINAVQFGNKIDGDNGAIVLKPDKYSLVWTDVDEITPIYKDMVGVNGEIEQVLIGYEENIDDFTPLLPPSYRVKTDKITRTQKIDLYEKLEDLAKLSFTQLDQYIEDNVVDLKSAKIFLKKQAKVLLALIKSME